MRTPLVKFLMSMQLALICVAGGTEGHAQYDINGNGGAADLILIQPQPDGSLRWIGADLTDSGQTDLSSFGQTGWEVSMATWEAPGKFTRLVLRKSEFHQFLLRIPGRVEEFSLGFWPVKVSVNAGRDINGNGTADVVMVGERERHLSWRFSFDPFSQLPSFKRMLFGRPGDIPFLFRARGSEDSLAVIRGNKIIYRSLSSPRIRTIRLGDFSATAAPDTVRGNDGIDTLLFSEKTSEGVLVTALRENKRSQHQFVLSGTLLIGDFTGSGEDTFGVFKSGGEFELANGELINIRIGGTPVGAVIQRSFSPEDISGTPLPQPSGVAGGGRGLLSLLSALARRPHLYRQ